MSASNKHDRPPIIIPPVAEWDAMERAEERAEAALRAAQERCCQAAMAMAAAEDAVDSRDMALDDDDEARLCNAISVADREVYAAGSVLARLRGGT